MICPLCEKDVPNLHKRSHLIPEWTYQNCYNENHKLIQFSIKNEFVTKKQMGLYDEIICEDCESKSQVYDRYASLILTEQSTSSIEYASIIRRADGDENVSYEVWENVDFYRLQKFVFICLLRTHLSLRKNGRGLLPEKHFNKMRELYHGNAIVDSTSYPIMLIKYIDDDDFRDVIILPFVNRRDGHHVIQYSCAGHELWVYVSSHKKPDHVSYASLNKNNFISICHISIKETGTFKKAHPTLSRLAKNNQMK